MVVLLAVSVLAVGCDYNADYSAAVKAVTEGQISMACVRELVKNDSQALDIANADNAVSFNYKQRKVEISIVGGGSGYFMSVVVKNGRKSTDDKSIAEEKTSVIAEMFQKKALGSCSKK